MMLKHGRDIMNWLNNNGFQVNIAQDIEYSYSLPGNIIYIGSDTVRITENWFKDFLKTYGCAQVAGHHITVPSFSDEELSWFATVKAIIAERYETDEKTANLKYWSIQDELAANKWAIQFINTHYQEAKKLDTIMTLAN